jgi:hypothetical protein
MNPLVVFYRISDEHQCNNKKTKPDYATKETCLLNFLKVFGKQSVFIVADCCSETTVEWIKSLGLECLRTEFKNGAKSFLYAVQVAIQSFPDGQRVYLVEHDYLHVQGAREVLLEGLEISDYVTLYSHPDKFKNAADGGNPLITDNSEETRVYLTNSCHWKLTNSTTMTFATTVGTLKEDLEVLTFYNSGAFPHDFIMFRYLIENKKRKLISSLPGYSSHMETAYLSPLVDWESISKST